MRSLLGERRRIGALGPSHVAEMLDRMHATERTPPVRIDPSHDPIGVPGHATHRCPWRARAGPRPGASAYQGLRQEVGRTPPRSLRSLAVADTTSDPSSALTAPIGRQLPPDLTLTPLVDGAAGQSRPLMDWLTTFHLASVILDPYTNESSWILRTATRILEPFRGSDARINLVVTSGPKDAQAFLGPLAERFLVFCDPDRAAVKAIGLSELPAFAFIRVDGVVAAVRPGVAPARVGRRRRLDRRHHLWSSIIVPGPNDPGPFRGSPALG